MILSAADRVTLATLYPFPTEGMSQADEADILTNWFVDDHFDGNPAYTWTDNESQSQ